MALPAHHRMDVESVYVSIHDTAWDQKKIEGERTQLGADEFHDVDVWLAGDSRYDPACMPSGYFIEDDAPVYFHIRRLGYKRWAEVQAKLERGSAHAIYDAFQACITSIRGIQVEGVVFPGSGRGELSDSEMEQLAKILPRKTMEDVGRACIRANQDLTPIEKKPYGS